MIYNYKIRQTKQFELELRNLYNYLLFYLQEPITAERNLRKIIDKIYSLQYSPERFPKIITNNKDDRNLRKLSINNYIIIYEVNNKIRSSFYLTYFS